MTDRPILFSGPMVRALLSGRKTQTRRVLKPQPYLVGDVWWVEDAHSGSCHLDDLANDRAGCMKYQAGDRLWVREAFTCEGQSGGEALYRATVDDDTGYYAEEIAEIRWRPSIFMPRWASRLTLIVTDVRVQRLREISEDDAIAEGINKDHAVGMPNIWGWRDYLRGSDRAKRHFADPRDSFRTLWDSLNEKRGYGWGANPWACAISFTVHRCNIDQMEDQQ